MGKFITFLFFLIFLCLAVLFISNSAFSQQVGVGTTVPDSSAILHIESPNLGFLPPRMSSAERDQILNPAEGLIIYNTDEKCIQFNFGTPNNPGWLCSDGTSCEPQAVAHAGSPQLVIDVTTTVLDANTPPENQFGEWEIISGEGGVIQDINDPNSVFDGWPNEQYVLRWTVSNICGSNYDEVIIDFQLDCPSVGDEVLGGIVAYILPGEGCTGIVATLQDQAANVQWGCRGPEIGTSYELGEGENNTNAIISFHDNLEPSYYTNPEQCHEDNDGDVAAKFCEGTINGFSDWFLPSAAEVTILYENLYLQGIGNMVYSGYWSSSESTSFGTQAAYLHFMGNSSTTHHLKTAIGNNVRCIRYFSE